MSGNPNQRITYSITFLHRLREKVKQAYYKSTEQELITPKNADSPYYELLASDIQKVLGITEEESYEIPKGSTFKKFFNTNPKFLLVRKNRTYSVRTIQIIEKYVSLVFTSHIPKDPATKKDAALKGQEEIIRSFAHRIYIEVTTRKAAIPIDEENDVIEEIYNSWYKLFCIIRDEVKLLPVVYLKEQNGASVIGLATEILNGVLRPHLTEHQAKFRSWLKEEKQNKKYRHLSPQELQRKYPEYKTLISSIKEVNSKFFSFSKKLYNFPPKNI